MGEFWSELNGYITPFALAKLKIQYDLFQYEEERIRDGVIITICTGTYWKSMGIPCWHMIKERLNSGDQQRIQPLDFHPYWHWYKPPPGSEIVPPQPPILDPEVRDRRRTQLAEQRA